MSVIPQEPGEGSGFTGPIGKHGPVIGLVITRNGKGVGLDLRALQKPLIDILTYERREIQVLQEEVILMSGDDEVASVGLLGEF